MQPVHSWKCSQMTDGRAAEFAASTIRTPAADDNPMVAATPAQNCINCRRETLAEPGICASGSGPRQAV